MNDMPKVYHIGTKYMKYNTYRNIRIHSTAWIYGNTLASTVHRSDSLDSDMYSRVPRYRYIIPKMPQPRRCISYQMSNDYQCVYLTDISI